MNKSFNQRYNILLDERSDLSYTKKQSDILSQQNYNKEKSQNSVRGIVEKSILSELFFSPENMKIIQNGIRSEVYRLSNYKYLIGEQSNSELEIVMRSIYLQYSYAGETDLKKEIKRLNLIVIKETVPGILTEVLQFLQYTKDINQRNKIMSLPKNVNNKGLKRFRDIGNVLET